MKIRKIRDRDRKMLTIDLTPLIDVVFLLLIFFMVGTTFIEVNTGIKIELPKSTVKELSKIKEIIILADKNENVQLLINEKNGKRNTVNIKKTDDLKEILAKKLANSENKNIIIKADKSLSHGFIVDIMTKAKDAGALSLDIATENSK
ncbi:biopolymer transport protein ExbD [Hypnocyclicus thermotrophus]|uniref:Biopolymer transport protein ExbD n=1 Tax=Hypnocyclicus thermotrophus TaxID=1627895 RepID=A0AA46DZA3_9FUSO|nr:biopolymer transporter ExbD [Hypnocyclicus thermotrophus]TDT71494.1 biopolymer transport protein ExbD [Hypnocyclicus thermotrophus]